MASPAVAGHAPLAPLVSLVLLAAYSCGTYGAGGYGTTCSTNTTVGVPNTGFAPLEALQSMATNGYFLLGLLISVSIAFGLLVLFLARRRRRK
jgi:hypothetical protein